MADGWKLPSYLAGSAHLNTIAPREEHDTVPLRKVVVVQGLVATEPRGGACEQSLPGRAWITPAGNSVGKAMPPQMTCFAF